MKKSLKIGIVGIGGTGSAAVRFLAAAGQDVTAFEQFVVGHTRGSSHGQSRIIRYTYTDAVYTQMMGAAYPLWQALEAESGEELLVRTGGIFFGDRHNSRIAAAQAALEEHGVAFELLSADESQDRFPALRLTQNEVALYEPNMGYLRASACVLATVRLARAQGAVILEQTPVQSVTQTKDKAVVRTESGEEHAFDRVIVTAGPWMGRLFASLNLPLRVTRQQVAYLKPEPASAPLYEADQLPVWIDADTYFYGFPSDGQIAGVKLAHHFPGEETDPDSLRRDAYDEDIAPLTEYASSRFSGLTGEVTYAQTCLYTNTPNEDFLIGPAPDAPCVFLVSGCSGHGFKFTVLLGKLAADAVMLGILPPSLDRFAVGTHPAPAPALPKREGEE